MAEHVDHFLFFSDNITNENVVFDDSETRHITNVLRLSIGDNVKVTDGDGSIYTTQLEVISKKSAIGKIIDKQTAKRVQKINLYIGIPEKDSLERLLPMIVPQGVDSIVPVICEFCQKAWWEKKWDKILERFTRVMITSLKQCWNSTLPKIERPIAFSEFINLNPQNLYFADEFGVLACNLAEIENSPTKINCIVGPPGGFSSTEYEFLMKNGEGVKLSDFRLRSELAGSLMISALYNCGVINLLEKKVE